MAITVTYANDVYASVDDVRGKLADGETFTDEQITDALEMATALIHARAQTKFGQITSQTIYDVRSDTVVLNTNGTIDEVLLGDVVLSPNTYAVTPWGIRFFTPPGGVWVHPSRPYAVEPIRTWWTHGGRGVTLTVNGTFGEPIGKLIQKAAVLLALEELGSKSGSAGSVTAGLGDDVKSFSVEGMSVTLEAGAADETGSVSTGSREADRLIDFATGSRAFVA